MAKRKKDSMALFEVIARDRQKKHKAHLAVPDWMKGPIAPDASADLDQAQPESQEYIGQAESEAEPEAAVPRPAVQSPEQSDDERASVFTIADGRVTLSLNYVSSAVAVAGLLLAVVGAFVLGRIAAPSDAPAGTGDGKPQARAGLMLGNTPARTTQRISGKYYLLIQKLGPMTPTVMAEGKDIVDFCRAARDDDPATIIRDRQQYMVLSGKPFDSPTGADARKHAAEIHALGDLYKIHKKMKYDFNQMDSGGKLDPWFRKEP